MRTVARALTLAAMLASVSSVASAYYHWTYFASRNAPFVPISAKFNLAALHNNNVSYFVSDRPPSTLVPNDNYDSLLSQIRLAAETWNGVSSSQIRLRFGGVSTVGTPQAAAGIDVVFDDDMPPGLFALTKVSTPSDLTFLAGADPTTASVPILRSRLQLRSDLTVYQQASFSDTFFMTIVHEFGHTVGLQHSMSSATMATALTRGTSKALPLSADDIASISLLYPASGFSKSTGSIAGQVTVLGNGMGLASVVALSANGTAIGGMTNPDGTYRIEGVPPGDYYVYAHPLPPPQQGETQPAAIVPPVDPNGQPFPADTSFDTQFFPGTKALSGATLVTVTAATTAPGINFNLQSRPAGAAIYDMQIYAYLGPSQTVPVQAPPLVSGDRRNLVFTAPGLLVPNTTTLTPGLSVSVLGEAAQFEASTLAYYTQGFLLIVVDANAVSSATPVAVIVNTHNDLYVLPAAFHVVPSQAPVINSISSVSDKQGNATVTIAGSNLSPDMRFLFDGFTGTEIKVNDDATLTMTAPVATGTHTAAVEVLASDGQSSLQALGTSLPPMLTYGAPGNPSLAINPANFNAGVDTMVEIKGFNTNFRDEDFADGETLVGFGSSDITIGKTWVMDPGRILLNVSVSPSATPGPATVTVATGLQVVTLNTVVQIQPPKARPISLLTPVIDLDTGLPGVPPGGIAVLGTSGLPANINGWMLTISGLDTGFSVDKNQRIYASVPPQLPLGPAAVQLIPLTGDPIPAVLMNIDEPPPVVVRATRTDGTPLYQLPFVVEGDAITLTVARLAGDPSEPDEVVGPVHLSVGGIEQTLTSVTPPDQSGFTRIQFSLSAGFRAGSQQPITVRNHNRLSPPYWISLAPAPAP
jgi:hypothetical protein